MSNKEESELVSLAGDRQRSEGEMLCSQAELADALTAKEAATARAFAVEVELTALQQVQPLTHLSEHTIV